MIGYLQAAKQPWDYVEGAVSHMTTSCVEGRIPEGGESQNSLDKRKVEGRLAPVAGVAGGERWATSLKGSC